MKDIDLSLDMLKVPLMEGYSPSVGTWVSATEQNKGVLTAAEVADNVALPWTRNRPVLVYESCRLGRADYDAVIVAAENGITVMLPEACSYMGCTVTVRAFPGISSVTVADSAGKSMCSVRGGTSAEFFWDDGKFVTMSVSGAGGSGGMSGYDQPYKNGMWAFDPFNNPITMLADSRLNDVFVTGTAKKNGVTNNALQVTGIKFVDIPTNKLPDNFVVIRMKPTNEEWDRKSFFLLTTYDNKTVPVWAAYGCSLPDKDGKIIARSLLGFCSPDSIEGNALSYQVDMFNQVANPYINMQWLPFNFRLSDMEMDGDGFMYIGLSCSLDSGQIRGWGMADRNTDRIIMSPASLTMGLKWATTKISPGLSSVMIPVSKTNRDILVSFYGHTASSYNLPNIAILDEESFWDDSPRILLDRFVPVTRGGYGWDLTHGSLVRFQALIPKEYVVKNISTWIGFTSITLCFESIGTNGNSVISLCTEPV